MVMLNTKIPNWVKKYSHTSFSNLSPGTIHWYKYCDKIGRREYLKRSRIKSKKFEHNHPGDRLFRLFKFQMKDKNVSLDLMLKFRELVYKNKSIKGFKKNIHLTPQAIYDKMIKENE